MSGASCRACVVTRSPRHSNGGYPCALAAVDDVTGAPLGTAALDHSYLPDATPREQTAPWVRVCRARARLHEVAHWLSRVRNFVLYLELWLVALAVRMAVRWVRAADPQAGACVHCLLRLWARGGARLSVSHVPRAAPAGRRCVCRALRAAVRRRRCAGGGGRGAGGGGGREGAVPRVAAQVRVVRAGRHIRPRSCMGADWRMRASSSCMCAWRPQVPADGVGLGPHFEILRVRRGCCFFCFFFLGGGGVGGI